MNNGWKSWALAAVTALLVGLLGGGYLGAKAADGVEARLKDRIDKVEASEYKNFEIIISMSERLVRIETKLDALKD